MPRRGKFGRRRGGQPNLTALIAALMREQRQAEDRVIFDAYANGGLVDGKPVTDSRMLAYIKSRRDGFAKDDPLWAEWDNRATQQQFKIGEEKIGLAFKQGEVGAGAVAAFYRRELAKLPKDSPFYREVAGRAADWAKAAGGAARGRARGRANAGLKSKQDAVQKTWDDYGALVDAVTVAAQRAGLDMSRGVAGVDATDFQALFARGIVGPGGKPITWQDWRNATNSAYKGFDALIAINEQLKRGTKTLRKDKERFFTDTIIAQNTVDDRAKVELATDIWSNAVENADGDPRAILEAAQKYAASLRTILAAASSSTGSAANDAEFIGGLQNTLDAVMGQTPKGATLDLGDIQLGDRNVDLATFIGSVQADADILRTGKGFLGQNEVGAPLRVIVYPPDAELDPFGRKGLGPDSQWALVPVDGKLTRVILKGEPITAVGIVNRYGMPTDTVPNAQGHLVPLAEATPDEVKAAMARGDIMVAPENAQTIGYVFNDGRGTTTYGVIRPDGSITYTDSYPFSDAYRLSDRGYSVIVPGEVRRRGDGTTIYPRVATKIPPLSGETSVLVDPTINPADLRALASNAPDEATATAYRAAAETLENRHYTRSNYYDHSDTTDLGTATSNLLDSGAAGPLGQMVNQGLGILGDAMRNLTLGAAKTAVPTTPNRPPDLPPMAPPPLTASPPALPAPKPPAAPTPAPKSRNIDRDEPDEPYTPPKATEPAPNPRGGPRPI